jgi:hypothetical protein
MSDRNTILAAVAIGATLILNAVGVGNGQDLRQLKDDYARGIVVEGKPIELRAGSPSARKLGAQYVILTQDSQPVSSTHHFRSGDRFRLQFRVNQDGYVYILNRTVTGSSLTRGIDVVPASKTGGYKLLYPGEKSDNNHVAPDRPSVVPHGGFFQMDQTPGEEKMIIVVSRSPIDVGKYYDLKTGDSLSAFRSDSDGDIEAQLSRDLQSWSENAEFAQAPDSSNSRGITIDRVESVGIARDAKKPMVLVFDLIHSAD